MIVDHDTAFEQHGEGWIRDLRSRLEQDLDVVLVVTGEEGSGKSTLALHLALRFDPSLTLDQIHNNTESFVEYAKDQPPGTPVVLDEAFEGGFNRRAMSQANVDFATFLGEARALKLVMLLCFPRWQNLDPYIRRHRVAYRIHVPNRGEAEVYETVTDKFGDADPYQRLTTQFAFPDLEDHEIWDRYQRQKKRRIRDHAASMIE